MRVLLSILITTCSVLAQAPVTPAYITPADAAQHIGTLQEVCGTIDDGTDLTSDHARLKMGALAIVPPRKLGPAGSAPVSAVGDLSLFLNQPVRARGLISKGPDGVIVITVTQASHLQFEPNPAGRAAFRQGLPLGVAPGVVPPKPVKEIKPTYTPEAIRQKLQGIVELEAVIMPDGSVGRMRVVRSLDPTYGLDEQAKAALARWEFTPGSIGGKAVSVIARMRMTFTLR